MTEIELPSAREALRNAIDSARSGDAMLADAWATIARELREGATAPLVDRALERLTLHDVEGIVCTHGRVAVRRKAGVGSWFMHTDDGSNCATPDPGGEHKRRRPLVAEPAAKRPPLGVLGPEQQVAPKRAETLADVPKLAPDLLAGAMPRTWAERVHADPAVPDGMYVMGDPKAIVGEPVFGTVFERHVDDALRNRDRFMNYERGQSDPPSLPAMQVAKRWRDALEDGHPLPDGI